MRAIGFNLTMNSDCKNLDFTGQSMQSSASLNAAQTDCRLGRPQRRRRRCWPVWRPGAYPGAAKSVVRVLWGRPGWSRSSPIEAATRPRSTPSGWTISLIGMLSYLDAYAEQPNDVCFCVVSQGDRTAAIIPFGDRSAAFAA